MRIAQVAPLAESVPPPGYGGTERGRLLPDRGARARGPRRDPVRQRRLADVSAELVACSPRSLRLDDVRHRSARAPDRPARGGRGPDRTASTSIHWHVDYFHFPLSRRLGVPHVTTLHGRLDIPDLQPVYDEFSDMPVVSISDDQRLPLPQANWAATVHHGLPPDDARAASTSAASTSRSSGASRPRSGPTGRSRSRGAPACRSASPPRSTTRTASTSRRRSSRCWTPTHVDFIGEIGPEREERLPRARPRAALPDRLGGAVRAGDDRVDGLRHAGHRLSLRLRAGGDRRGRDRASSSTTSSRPRGGRSGSTSSTGSAVRADFEDRFSAERMAHDYLDVFERLIADYRRSHTGAASR